MTVNMNGAINRSKKVNVSNPNTLRTVTNGFHTYTQRKGKTVHENVAGGANSQLTAQMPALQRLQTAYAEANRHAEEGSVLVHAALVEGFKDTTPQSPVGQAKSAVATALGTKHDFSENHELYNFFQRGHTKNGQSDIFLDANQGREYLRGLGLPNDMLYNSPKKDPERALFVPVEGGHWAVHTEELALRIFERSGGDTQSPTYQKLLNHRIKGHPIQQEVLAAKAESKKLSGITNFGDQVRVQRQDRHAHLTAAQGQALQKAESTEVLLKHSRSQLQTLEESLTNQYELHTQEKERTRLTDFITANDTNRNSGTLPAQADVAHDLHTLLTTELGITIDRKQVLDIVGTDGHVDLQVLQALVVDTRTNPTEPFVAGLRAARTEVRDNTHNYDLAVEHLSHIREKLNNTAFLMNPPKKASQTDQTQATQAQAEPVQDNQSTDPNKQKSDQTPTGDGDVSTPPDAPGPYVTPDEFWGEDSQAALDNSKYGLDEVRKPNGKVELKELADFGIRGKGGEMKRHHDADKDNSVIEIQANGTPVLNMARVHEHHRRLVEINKLLENKGLDIKQRAKLEEEKGKVEHQVLYAKRMINRLVSVKKKDEGVMDYMKAVWNGTSSRAKYTFFGAPVAMMILSYLFSLFGSTPNRDGYPPAPPMPPELLAELEAQQMASMRTH